MSLMFLSVYFACCLCWHWPVADLQLLNVISTSPAGGAVAPLSLFNLRLLLSDWWRTISSISHWLLTEQEVKVERWDFPETLRSSVHQNKVVLQSVVRWPEPGDQNQFRCLVLVLKLVSLERWWKPSSSVDDAFINTAGWSRSKLSVFKVRRTAGPTWSGSSNLDPESPWGCWEKSSSWNIQPIRVDSFE